MTDKTTTHLPDTELVTKRSMDRIPVSREDMIATAQSEQTKPYVPNMDGIGTHMLLRFYKDPKNEPGVVSEKIKTFYAPNEEMLRFAIANHAQKYGIIQMANIPVKDMEKLQNEESKESA